MREEVRVRRCGRRSGRLGRVLRPRGCFVGCAPFILEPLQPFRPRARLREFEARLCLDRARRSRRRRWRLRRQRRSHFESKRHEGRPATRPCTRECRLTSILFSRTTKPDLVYPAFHSIAAVAAMATPSPSSCPFESVEDSPFLRAQLRALDEGVDELRERTVRLSKGCGSYRDGLEDSYLCDVNFAESVRAFHGPLDDSFGTQVGASEIDRLCGAFRDIADARGVLLSTIENDLCGKLEALVAVDLRDAGDAKRRFERCSQDVERARVGFLKLTKDTKPELLKAAELELTKTRREHDSARFHLMSRLHEADSKKKITFKRQIARAVDAHRVFFAKANDILGEMKPFCDSIITECDVQETQMTCDLRSLVDLMAAHTARREDETEMAKSCEPSVSSRPTSDRSRAIQTAMHLAEKHNRHARSGSSLGGDDAFAVDFEETGNGSASENRQNVFDTFDRARVSPSGNAPQFLASGYLLKRSSSMRADWKRRFFVLDAFGHLGYYRDADFGTGGNGGGAGNSNSNGSNPDGGGALNAHTHTAPTAITHSLSRAKDTVSLLTATIKIDLEDAPNLRFCFRVVSPGKTYALQAESETDRSRWMEAITAAVAGLLSNSNAISQSISTIGSPGDKGKRSTAAGGTNSRGHSRSSSFSTSLFFGTKNHKRTTSTVSSDNGNGGDTSFELVSPSRGFGGHGGPAFATRRDTENSGGASVEPECDPLETLARVRGTPGNELCCDCGDADPEWASLNLGVTLCIECGGAHRQLGVHISKVRSCVLDVKVWEESMVALFQAWGNVKANAVWERALVLGNGESQSVKTDEKETPPSVKKPTARSSLETKTEYSIAKWGHRRFLLATHETGGKTADDALARGVLENCVDTVMRAVANGADVNESFSVAASKTYSCLRAACERGFATIVECLLQNGADVNLKTGSDDASPLHAAVVCKQDAIAKLLLRRGASVTLKNALGKTALDAAMDRGSISDEALFLALSWGGGK